MEKTAEQIQRDLLRRCFMPAPGTGSPWLCRAAWFSPVSVPSSSRSTMASASGD